MALSFLTLTQAYGLSILEREKGDGGEWDWERNIDVKTLTDCLPYMHWPGIEPATEVRALTGE